MLVERNQNTRVIHNQLDTTFTDAKPDPALRKNLATGPRQSDMGSCGELRHKKGLKEF